MSDRAELIRNALAFLADPNTRNHPLTQRIAFLESKGLTTAEIESVLAQSQPPTPSSVSSSPSPSNFGYTPSPHAFSPQYVPLSQPPPLPQRDWRDYFIMAVVSGGFMFGAYSFARKYLLPHLKPPTATAYEIDHDVLTAQFDQVTKLVASIESETSAQRTALDVQREKVDDAIDKLQLAINETRDAEAQTKADLRDIREEVNNVREMLPKMLERNKDAQSQALLDLQQELKSLKALLLSRGGPPVSSLSSPSTGGAAPLPRPSIPPWQLATPRSERANTIPTPAAIDKGKGKEVEPEPLANSGVLVSDAESEAEVAGGVIA